MNIFGRSNGSVDPIQFASRALKVKFSWMLIKVRHKDSPNTLTSRLDAPVTIKPWILPSLLQGKITSMWASWPSL